MTARWPLPFVLVFGLTITRAASPAVTIDTALTLSADAQATNAIDARARRAGDVEGHGVKSGFTYTVPAHGIVALMLETR